MPNISNPRGARTNEFGSLDEHYYQRGSPSHYRGYFKFEHSRSHSYVWPPPPVIDECATYYPSVSLFDLRAGQLVIGGVPARSLRGPYSSVPFPRRWQARSLL